MAEFSYGERLLGEFHGQDRVTLHVDTRSPATAVRLLSWEHESA